MIDRITCLRQTSLNRRANQELSFRFSFESRWLSGHCGSRGSGRKVQLERFGFVPTPSDNEMLMSTLADVLARATREGELYRVLD